MGAWPVQNRVTYVATDANGTQSLVYLNGLLKSTGPGFTPAAATTAAELATEDIFTNHDILFTAASAPSAATIYFYPPCLNQHVNGILHKTSVPAEGVLPELLEHTEAAVTKMMETLNYEGILCVEFFVSNTPTGQQLIANEMAPRVHNSGHWSIEGAVTSQFTNHILAVTRQPLGSTATHAKAVMINLVGTIPLSLEAPDNINAHLLVKESIGAATVPRTVVVDTHEQNQNVTAHIYGKSPRPGRKLGHITAVGENAPRIAESVLNG